MPFIYRTKQPAYNYYLLVLSIAACLWFLVICRLMIVSVWDETIFMAVSRNTSIVQWLYLCWTDSRIYRPLANSLIGLGLWLFPLDKGWLFLRFSSVVMVLASFWIIADAAKRQYIGRFSDGLVSHPNVPENLSQEILFWYWLVVFFSPSVLIVSAWFPNIFDSSCLLLIAAGVSAWGRMRWCIAGGLFGLAWFCKEAAIFILPLLGYLYLIAPASRIITIRSGLIYLSLGTVYWFLRSRVIAFGSSADIHPIIFSNLLPSIEAIAQRFILPGVSVLPGAAGLMITLVIALSARSLIFFGFTFALILCAAFAYLGSVIGVHSPYFLPLMNSAIFEARYFHIPLALLMFGLLLQGRAWPFMVMLLAFATSTPFEFQRFRQFQLAYQTYYQLAAESPNGITIFVRKDSGVQQLVNNQLKLKIGEYSPADYVMNLQNGSLQKVTP